MTKTRIPRNVSLHTTLRLPVIALVGWINRDQQAVIDYLIEENSRFAT